MAMRRVTFLLLFLVLKGVQSTQLVDIGAIHSCVPVNTTACSSSISYTVPEAIAKLSSIKDAFIEGILQSKSQVEDETCLAGIRELLCREEYPHCNKTDYTVNIITPNCTSLLSTCSRDSTSQYCPFSLSNAALGQCRQVSTYATENNYNFQQCHEIQSDWSTSTYITEWSVPYLIKRDQEVNEEINFFGQLNEVCLNKYRTFRCGGIGVCNGNRTTLQTNRNDCEYLRDNCLSNNQRNTLSHLLNCDLWPVYTPPLTPSLSPSPSQTHTSQSSHFTSTSSTFITPSQTPPPSIIDGVNFAASQLKISSWSILTTVLLCGVAITIQLNNVLLL